MLDWIGNIWSILMVVLGLGLIIFLHELGHFVMAKKNGVRVEIFSLGFGPVIWSTRRGDTEYRVSWVPLGGYVKMSGEQQVSGREKPKPYDYLAQPVRNRAAIIFAGPLVNYITAFLCLWLVFVIGFPELRPTVGTVVDDMPAQAAGVQSGDRIVSIGGDPVETWVEMTEHIHAAADEPLSFELERDGAMKMLTITPQPKDTTDLFGKAVTIGLIGISPGGEFTSTSFGPVEAFGEAIQQQHEWTVTGGDTAVGGGGIPHARLACDQRHARVGLLHQSRRAVRAGVVHHQHLGSRAPSAGQGT